MCCCVCDLYQYRDSSTAFRVLEHRRLIVRFKGVTHLFSDTRETTSFPALVHRLGDPVDPRVPTNLIIISREVDNIVVLLTAL